MAEANITSSRRASRTSPAGKHQSIADDVVGSIGAALTDEQVHDMETGASSNEIGQVRRVVLLVCAKTGMELRKIGLEAPEVFEAMLDAAESFRNHTKALNEVAEAAFTRLLVAYQDAEGGAA